MVTPRLHSVQLAALLRSRDMSNTSPCTSRHTCLRTDRACLGQVRLGSSESEEHHKALKMLKLSSLRQLQREVSGCCPMKHVRCHCHRFCPVLCGMCQVMLRSRVRHSCIIRVALFCIDDIVTLVKREDDALQAPNKEVTGAGAQNT